MINYFEGYTTQEEVKTRYKELAKQYHPDINPDPAALRTMQAINGQYAIESDNAIRREKPEWTEEQYRNAADVAEVLRQAIEQIINLDGITIEINGLWVWLAGDTKPHKDTLKAAGYKWASKKKQWYFPGIPARNRGKTWTHERIRGHYGSATIKSRPDDERKRAPQPATLKA